MFLFKKLKRRLFDSDALVSNESISTRSTKSKFLAYIRALRPRQWTKNLIVFAAPLFSFNINIKTLVGSLIAFAIFCFTSSSFYLINDIIDVESDRRHPVKCKRPIAAGLVNISTAITMAAILLGTALIVGWLKSFSLGTAILGYALLQVAYNLQLKHKVIADVAAISLGFILRAWGGSAATGIVLSSWFLLCTAMLALFLGIEKRKAELRLSQIKGHKPRAVLRRYSLPLLTRMESVATNGTILTYAIWSSGPVVHGASTPWMMLTLPFVLYGILRYQYLSDPQEIARRYTDVDEGGKTERPEEVLLGDQPMLLNLLAWVAMTISILLIKRYGFFS